MRVFVATFFHETNAASPIPTNAASFREVIAYDPPRGPPTQASRDLVGYGAIVRAAEAAGWEVFASSFQFAQPSAPCSAAAFASLRDEIIEDLRRGGPFDAALFFLHGAATAQGCDDCEGDLLAAARRVAGPKVVIGVELDLHANVSPLMLESADILLACKEYPHTDFDDRGADLFRIAAGAAASGVKPRTLFRRVPMLGLYYTTEPGLAAVNALAKRAEGEGGVLSTSLIHGFPPANVPIAGAGVMVVVHGEGAAPQGLMDDLAHRFFAVREESLSAVTTLDAALDRVAGVAPDAASRPFVLADCADNAGGGAGSDSTFALDALLARGLTDVAVGMIWDPQAAAFAQAAGVGAQLRLRLGGKTGPEAGRPLDVSARVLAVRDDLRQDGLGLELRLGLSVALQIEGVTVIVNSERQQVFGPSCFTDLGVDLGRMRAVVVKSTQHFRAAFGPLAREVIYVDTPGLMTWRLDAARHDRVPRPVWPFDAVQAAS